MWRTDRQEAEHFGATATQLPKPRLLNIASNASPTVSIYGSLTAHNKSALITTASNSVARIYQNNQRPKWARRSAGTRTSRSCCRGPGATTVRLSRSSVCDLEANSITGERDFEDLKLLISHQKAKHFKCDRCGKRLNTAGGMDSLPSPKGWT
jgi:hypothetical protein